MVRFIKWSLGIVAGLIVVTVIAVYIILLSYDFNDLKPRISKAAIDTTGRELTIDGDIDLEIGLTPSLVLSGIKFQNAQWGSRPEMVKLDRFEIQVALLPLIKRNIEIKRFILIDPDILIETNKSGKLNIIFDVPEKTPGKTEQEKAPSVPSKGTTQLPSLSFNKLEIVNGKLTYRDGKTGKSEQIILSKMLAGTEGMDDPIDLSLNGSYNKAVFDMEGRFGPLAALVDSKKECPIDITISAFDASIKLNGSVKDALTPQGVDIGFTVDIDKWDKISKIAEQPVPIKEALNVTGRMSDSGPKSYRIKDLKVKMGNMDIIGSMGIDLAGKIPAVDVNLTSKNLDLRPFIAQEEKKDSPVSKSKQDKTVKGTDKVFPDDPLPADALKKVDGKFQIYFDKVILPQLAVNKLEMDIAIKGGQLDVKPLKASVGGGNIGGSIRITPAGNALNMSTLLTVEDVELGDMLKNADITDMIEGIVDIDINLAGKGSSIASIMAGLNGHTSIIMGHGRINNKYIDLIGEGLSNNIFRLINPAREGKDYTVINCMVNRFDIIKGIADSTALVLDTELMSVIGEGEIDLGTEKLSFSLKPVPKKGVGGFKLSLGELAKPFKLGGTLANPSLVLDKTKAALTIGNALAGNDLFGPGGIAATLVSKSGDKDENPCVAAIEAAKTGEKQSEEKEEEEPQKTPRDIIEDVIKDPRKAIKNFFGR
jgi:uncharacterized protein involved in outer membrane biogenesis